MYGLSRALLLFAVIAGIFTLAIFTVMSWPLSGIGLAAASAARVFHGRRKRQTTLGSARFADEEDLSRAGMLDASSGLILGRASVKACPEKAIPRIWSRWLGPQEACLTFFQSLKSHTPLVRLNAVHCAIFAPTGAGKGVSFVIVFLKTCWESVVCIDVKGENSRLAAEFRRIFFGHTVVSLDPFHVNGSSSDSFNPLDFIAKDDPNAIDAAFSLAKAMIVRAPEAREPHWDDSAETILAAVICVVIIYGEPGARSLQTVREIICNQEKLELAVKLMCESTACGGMLARLGWQLLHFEGKEKASVLTTLSRHLRFLDTPAIAACTSHSSFNPALLLSGKMSIFLILPPEHMRSNIALLRLWISALFQAVIRGGLQEKNKVHFVLDEASSLAGLECIEDALDKYRAFGIRLLLIYQSLGQLQKCFPNGQDQTLLSNTSQIFFAVNDNSTAEFVSQRLGEETIVLESGGTSRGSTWQQSCGGQTPDSRSYSNTYNQNWQLQARKLLKPEEVIALHPRVAITFTPGVPPICTALARYYEEPKLGMPNSKFQPVVIAASVLIKSVFLFCVSVGIAVLTFATFTRNW